MKVTLNYKNALSKKIESYNMPLEDAILYKDKKNQSILMNWQIVLTDTFVVLKIN